MAIDIKIGAGLANGTTFVAADLGNITIGASSLTTLKGVISSDSKSVTVPGYGVFTLSVANQVTFKADASFPTGDYTFTDWTTPANGIIKVADLSAATAAVSVAGSLAMTDITTGIGADKVVAGAKTATITTGAGIDTIDTTNATGDIAVNAGDGNDTITHSVNFVGTITGGTGNDTITIKTAAKANNVVMAGDGDDTITVEAAGVATVSGGAGADTFTAVDTTAKLNVTDYKYAENDKVTFGTAATTIALNSSTGLLTADTNVVVKTEATDNVFKAKVTDGANGAKEYWTAVAGIANATMNGSAVASPMIIDATGAANVSIQGGFGADTITLGTAQATITASKSSGTDTVTGFTEGFSGDVLNISGATIADLKFGLSATPKGEVSIAGIKAITGLTDWTAATEGALLVQENGGTIKKVAFGATGSATITSLTADTYVAFDNTTIVDVSASTVEGATFDLNNSAKFVNVQKVKGAAGGGTYIGSTLPGIANDFNLSAATKATQVWGGSKATDTVTFEAAKAVQDVMWFGKTDGTDTVTNFGFGFGATKDIVNLYDVADVTALDITESAGVAADAIITTATGNTVSLVGVLGATDATQLQLKNQAGVVSKLALGTKAATATTIDGTGADMVIGKAETTTTLNTVKYTASTSALTVNLQDATKYKNIHSVDLSAITTAAAGTTNIVVGSADTVTGSALKLMDTAGTTTDVWGGSKAADVITGGAGVDTIWYGANDGTDTVNTFTLASDKIKFYDKTVSQLAGAYTYAGGVFTSTAAPTVDTLTTGAGNNVAFNVIDKNNTAVKAVVGNANLDYVKDAKVYIGGAASTLTVGATATEDVVLYLGNGTDAAFNDTYFAGITTINATNAVGKTTLIGSKSVNNVLTGGKVASAMWGGGMSSDTMNGQASAVDQFWFGTGDGIDSAAAGVDKGDTIVLYNAASINDVTMTVGTGQETIAMKDGSLLTITDNTGSSNSALNAGLTFQVGTGSAAKSYTYNTTSKAFVAK